MRFKMLMNAKLIPMMSKVYFFMNIDILQVIIVGRVLEKSFKEPDQYHYLINDNTGTIKVIDYKSVTINPDPPYFYRYFIIT